MKIASVHIKKFKRFENLTLSDLSNHARLVILAGPNGCGKSSLFDAFRTWHGQIGGFGFSWESGYHGRPDSMDYSTEKIAINFHGSVPQDGMSRRKLFYMRSAYRNDPEFRITSLARVEPIIEEQRFRKMIENDAAVTRNYQRLTSQALEDAFITEKGSTTLDEFRNRVLGLVREPLRRLFPDLILTSLGNPLEDGTFYFDKGTAKRFAYQNLSGGEKAAFDLLLDFLVKSRVYDNTVFCIDEPEAHMNTRLQGALLRELIQVLPGDSQLWLATHSIGMMRAARDVENAQPGSVAFIDFSDEDFDKPVTLSPVNPTRRFWARVLNVALDDLAQLVAPEHVIICEGNPAGPIPSKNAENDESCYNIIFADEFPQTMFVSGGNSKDVMSDRLVFAKTLQKLAAGLRITRLIDRDDHSPHDVAAFGHQGIRVLSRRNIECYLFDDEVLEALCKDVGKSAEYAVLLQDKATAMAGLPLRGKSPDDVASAAGVIYTRCKSRLGLTAVGNDYGSFMRYRLAPLVKPHMRVYQELRAAILTP